MSEPVKPVRRETVIDAPPERVFDAWADPEEIARWYVELQVGDPREDERIVWYITCDDLDGDGEPLAVRAAERGRRLVLENVGAEPWRGTVVEVELVPEDGGARVAVEQRGFSGPLRDFAPVVDSGWACTLAILKEYLERHAGEARSTAEAKREVDLDPAAAAEALASAEAIAGWSGELPERLLAATPHGAVAAFAGFPGVFTLMAAGGVTVWYTAWGEADLVSAKDRAEDLAERLATQVDRF